MKSLYVIVSATDATDNYRMLNQSLSRDFAQVRKALNGSHLFEVPVPVPDIFMPFRWYSLDEIRIEMQKAEWVGA